MAIIYVATTGSNSNDGLTEANAKLTITAGVTAAVNGDTVKVLSGVYDEAVSCKTGVNITGYGPTKPILDSNYTKTDGFATGSAQSFTVDNFEITRYTRSGTHFQSTKGTNANYAVKNCHIHHIRIAGQGVQAAIFVAYGNPLIEGNIVHDVGPGPEAEGCWTAYCHDHVVRNNIFYLCRKDGYRDYYGLNALVEGNRAFACFCGLDGNETVQSLWINNLVYDCVDGFNAKHTNDYEGPASGAQSPIDFWGINPAIATWCRFWHNTALRCTWGCFVVGPNAPITTQVDCRNNILGGPGGAGFWDTYLNNGGRTTDIVVDYNTYTPDRDFAIYHKGYTTSATHYNTVAATFAATGFEQHGRDSIDPLFKDPANHNYDPADNSPVLTGGVMIAESPYGAQVGARGFGPSPIPFTRHSGVTTVSTDEPDSFRKSTISRVLDGRLWGYYQTTGFPRNIVFDLGDTKTLTHFNQQVLSQGSSSNPKGFIYETADTPTGPWTQVLVGNNNDPQGADFKHELAEAVATRYVRYTITSSWGAAYAVLPELLFLSVGQVAVNPPGENPDPDETPEPPLVVPGGAYWGIRAA